MPLTSYVVPCWPPSHMGLHMAQRQRHHPQVPMVHFGTMGGWWFGFGWGGWLSGLILGFVLFCTLFVCFGFVFSSSLYFCLVLGGHGGCKTNMDAIGHQPQSTI